MERVPWEEKMPGERIGPTGLDELQIEFLVRPVDFVTHNRMAEMREMNTDLMRPPSSRNRPDN